MDNFKYLYLDPGIRENAGVDSSRKMISSEVQWYNHIIEDYGSIDSLTGNEVVMKVLGVTICNTDILEILNRGERKGQIGRRPGKIFLGHELVGKVMLIGENVTKFRPGDRVCVGDFNTCKSFDISIECPNCSVGKGVVCTHKHLRRFSGQSYGGFSEFMVRSEHQLFKISKEIDNSTACLLEPAAIAHNCYRQIKKEKSKNILIFGCGTIGIILVRLICHHLGQSVNIFCVSKDSHHQKIALDSGAFFACDDLSILKAKSTEFISDGKGLIGGFDYIFDFVGKEDSLNTILKLVKPGGEIFELAFPDTTINLNLSWLARNQIKLTGIHGYQGGQKNDKNDFYEVCELLRKDKINISDLVSKRVNFSSIRKALISECIEKVTGNYSHEGFRVMAECIE